MMTHTPKPTDILGHLIETMDKMIELEKQNTELLKALKDIRDLARTGLAPDAYGMDQNEWATHKVLRVESMANHVIVKTEGGE